MESSKVEFLIPALWEPFIERAKQAGKTFFLITTLGGQKVYGGGVTLLECMIQSNEIVEPHCIFDGVKGTLYHEVKYKEARQRKFDLLHRLLKGDN